MTGGGLLGGVDVSEYVGEALASIEEEVTNHDLAESIADTLCAQGKVPAARFELLVEELEAAMPYYR